MPFNNLLFWIAFVFLWFITFVFRSNVRIRNLFLLAASYFLYIELSGWFAVLLALSTVITYAVALALERYRCRRLLLLGGILFHLLVLSYLKYLNFFLGNAAALFPSVLDWPTTHLILPLGISFYTFQAIGYLVDIYRRTYAPSNSFLNVALFIAFFPKIVAGPIERGDHLLPQLQASRPIRFRQLQEGMYLIVWGLLKKFVIAENAAVFADAGFNHPSGAAFYLILSAFAFTLQIYADFSGYSDIAKGIAALLGFDLVWNFDIPYVSASPSEFWKRWHISLSGWFRDYVYIPLGGNRKGFKMTMRNLLITMLCVGLWHGANWTFVVWGLYCGLLLVIYRIAGIILKPFRFHRIERILRPFSILLFFLLTVFGWVIFRSDSLGSLVDFLQNANFKVTDHTTYWYILLLWLPIVALEYVQLRTKDKLAVAHAPALFQAAFYCLSFYALLLLPPLAVQEFIYAKF